MTTVSQQRVDRSFHRRSIGIIGISAAVACVLQCQRSGPTIATTPVQAADARLASRVTPQAPPRIATMALDANAAAGARQSSESLEDLARTDPVGFAEYCLQQCRQNIRDYKCTFIKHEQINHTLLDPQTVEVRFRARPFSVDMQFVKNVRSCSRALYVAGKWRDSDNQDLAWAKPGGAILRALVPRIKQPIHGPRAYKESRRTIDQFGFENTLELIVKYARIAESEGVLDLRYKGHGEIDGRPTYVFERRLPYTGEDKPYPDRILVYHIDQQYLVPTACYSYADDNSTDLLGSYVYRDVQFNVGYQDDDFDPDLIDF